jgi:hypothetical protein
LSGKYIARDERSENSKEQAPNEAEDFQREDCPVLVDGGMAICRDQDVDESNDCGSCLNKVVSE